MSRMTARTAEPDEAELDPLLGLALEETGAALVALGKGRFFRHCEVFGGILHALPRDLGAVLDGGAQVGVALQREGRTCGDLRDALLDIREALLELDPCRVRAFLLALWHQVEELDAVDVDDPDGVDEEEVQEEAPAAALAIARRMRLCLRLAGPSQLLSRLFALDELLLEARPRGGFQLLATHPAVLDELGPDNYLHRLALLEETLQLAMRPENLEALASLERVLGRLGGSPGPQKPA